MVSEQIFEEDLIRKRLRNSLATAKSAVRNAEIARDKFEVSSDKLDDARRWTCAFTAVLGGTILFFVWKVFTMGCP